MDVTSLLVDLGSDMYALDSQGQTPMMLAIENDHSEIVKLFLRKKPDLATMSNAKGFTCAHIAAMKGSTSVIKELMKFNKSIGRWQFHNFDKCYTTYHVTCNGKHIILRVTVDISCYM